MIADRHSQGSHRLLERRSERFLRCVSEGDGEKEERPGHFLPVRLFTLNLHYSFTNIIFYHFYLSISALH